MAHSHDHHHETSGDHGHGGQSDGGHEHGRSHSHAPADFGRAFLIGIGLNTAYVLVEAGFGFASHSLALLADAGHNLSDVFGLALAWFGATLARRAPTPRRTYGYKRGPILASLGNAVLLLVTVGAITWESARRLLAPEPVGTEVVIWVAVVGVLVNAGTAWLFMSGRKGDLNVRGAFFHMAADAAVTVGVIVAALLIQVTGWDWLDPAISLVISAVIVWSTWGLLRASVDLAMDAVPDGVDAAAVSAFLLSRDGVAEVHDLHVWGLGTTEVALTAHLVRGRPGDDDGLLRECASGLRTRFGIGHATIQLETAALAADCALRPDHVV